MSVVIVGRTNVGKSTLFNRLVSGARNLVFDAEGITRYPLKEVVEWCGIHFQLIDTGGIGTDKGVDELYREVHAQAYAMAQKASLILFICDGTVGILPEDREIARQLHRLGVKVLLYVNKCDSFASLEHQHDFLRLGFGDPVHISSAHGTGISELLDGVVTFLKDKPQAVESFSESSVMCSVVLIGKPNVGKSSLMNCLLGQQRSIVSDIPGTTREAVADHVRFHTEEIKVVDTAGIRRKRGVDEPLEQCMVKSSLRAIDNADIVVLLVDASAGCLSDQELKLAFYAFEERHKGLIILFNKSDLIDDTVRAAIEDQLDQYNHLSKKVAHLYMSCKTEKNLSRILPLVKQIQERRRTAFNDTELTTLFVDALHKRPLYKNGQMLKLYKVRQVSFDPTSIIFDINMPTTWFGQTQQGFFDNLFRRTFNMVGAPVKFIPRYRGKLLSQY